MIRNIGWEQYFWGPVLSWYRVSWYFNRHCSNPFDKVYGLQGLLHPKNRVRIDYSICADELFFRILSNVCFNKISSSGPPRYRRKVFLPEDWGIIVHFLVALLDALKPRVPLTLLMHLVWVELKIRRVRDLDMETGKYREANGYAEYLEIFRSLWDDCPRQLRDMARKFPAVSQEPDIKWTPPPSYRVLRRSQKIRYLLSFNRAAKRSGIYSVGKHCE